MSAPYVRDTIAAVATAPGKGGIGVVRVSGPLVESIAVAMLGRLPPPRYAALCQFSDENSEALDHGIALFFPGPSSFTGEDVLEMQGHGGPVVLDMLLARVISLGARVANPGEFSQRAFLNDKLDLTQAEAIADLIDSGTKHAARSAMRSLEGRFSRLISALVAEVVELRVYVEAAIDFPEEEIDFISDDRIMSRLKASEEACRAVLNEANTGALLVDGASVVLLGKPNVGKSSLMNMLTGTETSIVTHIPGTTRDVVDESFELDGIPLRLIDTAGIRESDDLVETEGVKRALAATASADLVILVVDATTGYAQIDAELVDLSNRVDESTRSHEIVVYNKLDLPGAVLPRDGATGISAMTGQGMDELRSRLKRQLGVGANIESGFTARTRHVVALEQALQALVSGRRELESSRSGELLAEELKICQDKLGEITGEFTADDLLGEIFSSFCIGK